MYGLFTSLSILISSLFAEHLAKKEGLKSEILWSGIFWVILGGLAGARIYHLLDFWEVYSNNPLLILQIWNGGLGIIGGIAGGLLALSLYLKKNREPVLPWLDIAGTVLPLGQAIGRWGNYFNGEILPYAVYESAFSMLLFISILVLRKKLAKVKGSVFLFYLIGYSFIRIFLEPMRSDFWEISGFNVAQVISLMVVFTSVSVIIARYSHAHKKPS